MRFVIFCLCLSVLMSACKQKDQAAGIDSIEKINKDDVRLIDRTEFSKHARSIPEIAFYHKQLIKALARTNNVLLLPPDEIIDSSHYAAQMIAVADPEFLRDTRHHITKEPLRTEIMTVRKALPSDLVPSLRSCDDCYRVEMYNYFYNKTTVATVDLKQKKLVHTELFTGAQADINKRLTDIATQIAIHSPEVALALGLKPGEDLATMSNVKTSLRGTKCERSKHLCVAPTFVKENRALWTIVDLTDFTLVGIRWTELGQDQHQVVTERSLQNDFIMTNYCQKENPFSRDGWEGLHRLTGSDGLEIIDVSFKGKKIINSAKIVDWHVSYSFKEGFGYSDATGCPMFSSAAVIAFDVPFIEDIRSDSTVIGFALVQDFRSPVWPAPCNYRYQNRYEFYKDGSFRIVGINLGRGCGVDGWYRPVFRMDLGPDDELKFKFEQYTSSGWARWNSESYNLQKPSTKYSPEGYLYRFIDRTGHGYYVEPSYGQFQDGGRGDFAYSYISVDHEDQDEGAMDMITIGACCNTDYRQGPNQFIEPSESIKNQKLIYWYVPQMKNDNTKGAEYAWCQTEVIDGKAQVKVFPGTVGPKFVPF